MVLGSVSDISVFYWSRIRMRLMALFVGWHLDSHWHWTGLNTIHNQNWNSQEMEFWRRNGDEQSNLHIYITPSSPPSLCGPCLLLGTRCVLCQQSLMANFSKFSPNHLSSPNFYLLTTETLSNSGQLLDQCWPQGGIDQLSSHSNNFKINIFIMPGEIANNADWLP